MESTEFEVLNFLEVLEFILDFLERETKSCLEISFTLDSVMPFVSSLSD
jgi:hypothetical protein